MSDYTILHEAGELTSGDRQRQYGHPSENHGCTAAMWTAYLVRLGWTPPQFPDSSELNARHVCWMNVLQKCSRDANAPKRDNLVDGAGFLRNAEMVEEAESQVSDGKPEAVDGGVRLPPFDFLGLHRDTTIDGNGNQVPSDSHPHPYVGDEGDITRVPNPGRQR